MLVYRSNKYHGQWLNNRHLSSHRLEAGHPRSRCWEAGLIPRCLPLAGCQPPASYAPPRPLPPHTHTHKVTFAWMQAQGKQPLHFLQGHESCRTRTCPLASLNLHHSFNFSQCFWLCWVFVEVRGLSIQSTVRFPNTPRDKTALQMCIV